MIFCQFFWRGIGISPISHRLKNSSYSNPTSEGSEFRMPETRQHREDQKSGDRFFGDKSGWWGEGVWPNLLKIFGTLVVFFSTCFFGSRIFWDFSWGDANNFGGDVYLNVLRDWFTSHSTGPGSLTVTCYTTTFSMLDEGLSSTCLPSYNLFLYSFIKKGTTHPYHQAFYERNLLEVC